MDRKGVRHIDTFVAVDEKGRDYTIFEFQHFTIVTTMGDGRGHEEEYLGLKELKTSDGRHVNRYPDGSLKVLDPWEDEIPVRRT